MLLSKREMGKNIQAKEKSRTEKGVNGRTLGSPLLSARGDAE